MARIKASADDVRTGNLGSNQRIFSGQGTSLTGPARKETRTTALSRLGDELARHNTAQNAKDAYQAEDLMVAEMVQKRAAQTMMEQLNDPSKARLSYDELMDEGLIDEKLFDQIGNKYIRRQAMHETKAFAKVTHGAAQKEARRQYDMDVHQSHFQQSISDGSFIGMEGAERDALVNKYRLFWEAQGYSENEIGQILLDTQKNLKDDPAHNTVLAELFLGRKNEDGGAYFGEQWQNEMRKARLDAQEHTELQRFTKLNNIRPEIMGLIDRNALTWEYFEPKIARQELTEGDANRFMAMQKAAMGDSEDILKGLQNLRELRGDRNKNSLNDKVGEYLYENMDEKSANQYTAYLASHNGIIFDRHSRTLNNGFHQMTGVGPKDKMPPTTKEAFTMIDLYMQNGTSSSLMHSKTAGAPWMAMETLKYVGMSTEQAFAVAKANAANKPNHKIMKLERKQLEAIDEKLAGDFTGRKYVKQAAQYIYQSGMYDPDEAKRIAMDGYQRMTQRVGPRKNPTIVYQTGRTFGQDPATVDARVEFFTDKLKDRYEHLQDVDGLTMQEIDYQTLAVYDTDGSLMVDEIGIPLTFLAQDLFATGEGSIEEARLAAKRQEIIDGADDEPGFWDRTRDRINGWLD